MLASHNTFTYAPVRQWWARPFAFVARCQDHDIITQYRCGARLLDLRLRVTTDYHVTVAHGLCTYRVDPFQALDDLLQSPYYQPSQPLYIRVICEDSRNHTQFSHICDTLAARYPSIRFCGGISKASWTTVHRFTHPVPPIRDRYGSWGHRNRLHNLLWSIYPRLWARLHNHRLITGAISNPDTYILLDFINTYPHSE